MRLTKITFLAAFALAGCESADVGGGPAGGGPAASTATPPSLSYAGSTGTSGYVGYPMHVTPGSLNANGAAVTACAIKSGTPALPGALSIDPSTCVISGTPTATLASTTYTVVASNSAGASAAATVTLSVGAASSHILVSDTGGTFYSCGLSATDGTVTSCLSDPLPGNVVLRRMSRLALNGQPYALIASPAYIYSCAVDPGNGAISSCVGASSSSGQTSSVAYGVASWQSNGTPYVYVAGGAGNQGDVYVCVLDPSTRWFSSCAVSNGGVDRTTWEPRGITIATIGSHAYAYVGTTSGVYSCAINAADGTLGGCTTTLAGVPAGVWNVFQTSVATIGGTPYVYVANAPHVLKCSVNVGNGTLTACAPSNGGQSSWMPQGVDIATIGGNPYAYVADGNFVYVCPIDVATGALTSCASTGSYGAYGNPFNILVY